MKNKRTRLQKGPIKVDLSEFDKLFDSELSSESSNDSHEDDYVTETIDDDWDRDDVEDYESIIMNALASGDADKYGF
jgi:hypothetical protein